MNCLVFADQTTHTGEHWLSLPHDAAIRRDVVMTTSALLRHGIGHMRTLLDGLTAPKSARQGLNL